MITEEEISHQNNNIFDLSHPNIPTAGGDTEARSAASPESYYMVTLREAPSGSPTITVAHNISSNALYMVGGWRL